ncbi:MAG: AAA domain-containing protein [Ruminococcus sp.]
MTFKDAAIYSSELYYNYLTKNKGALIKYKVNKITFTSVYCYIYLNQSLNILDDLRIKINSNIFSNEQYKIVEYDNEQKRLKIAPEIRLKEFLTSAKTDEVELIVDLRFLVKNVRKFYEYYGEKIFIPFAVNKVEYKEDERLTDKPSDEQAKAVIGALSHPLSYVWGAPGTGKTRFVLARCVLSYLQSNENAKILITAPTNNAVEQTLRGVLPVLTACGINQREVFRMGTPSPDFLIKYPDCCEFGKAENQLEKIEQRINSLEISIEEITNKISLFFEYKKAVEFEKKLEACDSEIPQLFSKMQKENISFEEYEDNIVINNGKIAYSESLISSLIKKRKEAEKSVSNYTELVNKFSKGIRKLFFKNKLNNYTSLLNISIEEFEKIKKEIEYHNSEIQRLKTDNEKLLSMQNERRQNFSKLLDEATKIVEFWNPIHNAVRNTKFDDIIYSLDLFYKEIEKGKSSLKKRKERYVSIQNITEDELYEQLALLNKEKSDLSVKRSEVVTHTASARLSSCRVLAATIDTCISRIAPDSDFKPSHIFLDEAGYCSLIKGVTLLTYHCPVTLLGDHMQLPPICEMDDNEFIGEDQLVALYAQSALYIEDCLREPSEIISRYLNHENPNYKFMVRYDLNYTFRFGETLANVLAENVYTPLFHGSQENNTAVYFINAPKLDPAKPRYSSTEIEKIINYINKYSNENIGIITPYKYQRNELIKSFNGSREILTVHGSQGREWNTVILSVVDSTNKWFTNSLNHKSNGKKVINTAVSRAKNKLVIVCDAEHWKTQHKQLIGQLIEIGEEIII